ncbi:MAG: ribose 5-phosphate isomerase B [Hydrotalea sp.]|jgi:ribose 5-phosphate isomerase B|nr:ribose 5-phosphate isomerase B [Hydrotalea sp.]
MNATFNQQLPIAIGADHAGVEYKQAIVEYLKEKGWQVLDFGTHGIASVDYPDFAHPVAQAVEEGKAACGILLCGSANGVNITANKHAGIRAALCWQNDIAALARQHNNANVISIPARFVALALAYQMIDTFLSTPFEGGRHENRVQKISCS